MRRSCATNTEIKKKKGLQLSIAKLALKLGDDRISNVELQARPTHRVNGDVSQTDILVDSEGKRSPVDGDF